MDYDELLELIEIEAPDEFGYFEHFAALVECDEEISYDLLYRILAEVDSDTLADLTDNYFEDVLQGIPEDAIDIFTLMGTIRQALAGLARSAATRDERIAYVDELYKFRSWYIFDSIVHLRRVRDNAKRDVTVSEALSLCRLEKLSEDQYHYDFSDSMDYEVDEYSIAIDAKLDEEYEEIIEEDEELYEEGLVDREFPVIDEDFMEEEEEDY